MTPAILLLVIGALFLAFSNGANDNFKGFATVWGSNSLSYRQALLLATVATAAGSLASLLLAHGLVATFSGKGLVSDAAAGDPAFITAAGLGAAATVMAATRGGMPISTTHALLGGLLGAGLAVSSTGVSLAALGSGFLLPLLISPLAAATLGALAYQLLRLRRSEADCACVVQPELANAGVGILAFNATAGLPRLVVAAESDCDRLAAPQVRFSISRLLDQLHILSAASICFARGVNDTPKLVALLIAARIGGLELSVSLVAVLMVAGGLLLSRRVAETMSLKVNHMDRNQGVSANLITALLVLVASKFGMPVSTTHVSVGSIAGVGASAGTLDWIALRSVLLSWLVTLPVAAAIAWAIAITMSWGSVA